jgi:hypothetical protein
MAYPMKSKEAGIASGMPDTLASKSSGGNGNIFKSVIALVVVLVIVLGGLYALKGSVGFGKNLAASKGVNLTTEWQAVFLSTGQVYFGKVTDVREKTLVLSNIYYLQVVTQQDTIAQPPDVQNQPEQRLTLIKLGNEIHGPKDEMTLNWEHVVMIEDLKDDSRVVQAIEDFINNAAQ